MKDLTDDAEPAPGTGVARDEMLGRLFAPRLFFLDLVVDGNLLQIFRFENLVTVQTADVIDPIAAHQEFRARMFTTRHSKLIIPILMMAVTLSSPFFGEGTRLRYNLVLIVSSAVELAALSGVSLVLMAAGARVLLKSRHRNLEKRERRRRTLVNRGGRLGDALITGFTGTLLHYSYSVHGVEYSASQEVGALRDRLPEDLGNLVGMAQLKYLAKNPANSILVCEEWSGMKVPVAQAAKAARSAS